MKLRNQKGLILYGVEIITSQVDHAKLTAEKKNKANVQCNRNKKMKIQTAVFANENNLFQ